MENPDVVVRADGLIEVIKDGKKELRRAIRDMKDGSFYPEIYEGERMAIYFGGDIRVYQFEV